MCECVYLFFGERVCESSSKCCCDLVFVETNHFIEKLLFTVVCEGNEVGRIFFNNKLKKFKKFDWHVKVSTFLVLICIGSEEEEETVFHCIYQCHAVARKKRKLMNLYFLKSSTDISDIKVAATAKFILDSGWLPIGVIG